MMNSAQKGDIIVMLKCLARQPHGWKPNVMQEKLLKEGSYLDARQNLLRSVTQMQTRTIEDLRRLRDIFQRYGSATVSIAWRSFDKIIEDLKSQVEFLETHPMVED